MNYREGTSINKCMTTFTIYGTGPILNPLIKITYVLKITFGALNARPQKLEDITSSPQDFSVTLVLVFTCIS